MKALSISEVRKQLPSVIDAVERSRESVVITRYGKPIASIVPFRDDQSFAAPYPLRGQPINVAVDFDEPAPELWQALAAAEDPGEYAAGRRRRSPAPGGKTPK